MTSTEPPRRAWPGLPSFLRRGVALTLVLGAVGLLGGLFLADSGDGSFTATTPILLSPLEGNPYYPSTRGEQLLNLETEAEALKSAAVADLVIEATDTDLSATELLGLVGVSVPTNTQILDVSATSADEDTALELSQEFAESYLTYRQQRAQARIDGQSAQLDEQIGDREAELAAAATELADTSASSADASLLRQRMNSLSGQVDQLSARKAELTGTPLDPGQVVTPAATNVGGLLGKGMLFPVAGLLAGLFAGVIIYFYRSQREDLLRSPADVADTGVTVLGTVGWWDGAAPRTEAERIALLSDEVRTTCISVLALENRRPFSLLVAPGGRGPARASIVTELANAFTRGGFETIIIDTTGELGDADADNIKTEGLSEILIGRSTLSAALTPVAPQTWLVGPGSDIHGASDLFVGQSLRTLLRDAKDRCDVIILAGRTAQDSFGQSLASTVDAVVLEIDQGSMTRRQLREVSRSLDILSESALGSVFLGADAADLPTRFTGAAHQRLLNAGTQALLPGEQPDDGSESDSPDQQTGQKQDPSPDLDTSTPDEKPERRPKMAGSGPTDRRRQGRKKAPAPGSTEPAPSTRRK